MATNKPAIKPTKIDLARMAAYIDGEGCILISEKASKTSQHSTFYLRVVLANTDPRLMLWCKRTFGGTFVVAGKPKKTNHRVGYKWYLSHVAAAEILTECLPYFIIKREQAEVAIAFQQTMTPSSQRKRGTTIPKETSSYRKQCREKLHELRWESRPPVISELSTLRRPN